MTAPDDLTVVYQLTSRSPVFLLLASLWPLYPTRQDLIDEHGDGWTEAGNHVSNGSFTLASWNHEQDITLVRNTNAVVQPRLETVFVDQITERNIALLAYQEGELDVAVLGPEEIAQARDDDALQAEAESYAQQVTLGVYFNFNVPTLTDKRVRQALSIALDRDQLVAIVLEGAGIPAYSWLPPGVPGHDNDFGRALYENRPIEDAQAMLAEAGFPGGEGLAFEVLISDSSTSKLVGEWFKEQWESKLGISIELIVREVATYFSERNQGLYQITTGGWGSDYADPQNWMPLFQTGGLLNSGDFSNADYDALLAAADQELDNARRIALYEEANQLFMDELPFAPTYFFGDASFSRSPMSRASCPRPPRAPSPAIASWRRCPSKARRPNGSPEGSRPGASIETRNAPGRSPGGSLRAAAPRTREEVGARCCATTSHRSSSASSRSFSLR